MWGSNPNANVTISAPYANSQTRLLLNNDAMKSGQRSRKSRGKLATQVLSGKSPPAKSRTSRRESFFSAEYQRAVETSKPLLTCPSPQLTIASFTGVLTSTAALAEVWNRSENVLVESITDGTEFRLLCVGPRPILLCNFEHPHANLISFSSPQRATDIELRTNLRAAPKLI